MSDNVLVVESVEKLGEALCQRVLGHPWTFRGGCEHCLRTAQALIDAGVVRVVPSGPELNEADKEALYLTDASCGCIGVSEETITLVERILADRVGVLVEAGRELADAPGFTEAGAPVVAVDELLALLARFAGDGGGDD